MEYLIYIIKFFLFVAICTQLFSKDIATNDIAKKIYQNECASEPKNLVHWNKGEEFVSLGIGHFIWYPKGVTKKFDESFPKLLKYMKNHNYPIPNWLNALKYSPFKNKNDLLKNPYTKKLKVFLLKSMNIQASFMADRMKNSLDKLLQYSPKHLHSRIKRNFYAILNQNNGDYILIDYVNFKGEGVKKSERYKGKGWGLLQVLSQMKETNNPKNEFINSAKTLLKQRVLNSPPKRGENRWLRGWFNRIDTYK